MSQEDGSSNASLTQEEFNVAVSKEIDRARHTIEELLLKYLNGKDDRINELEKEVQRLTDELAHKNTQLKECNRVMSESNRHVDDSDELKKENLSLKQEVNELKETISSLEKKYADVEKDAIKLKQLTDPTQEMRRKGQCIRPGDMTHEKVAKEFKNIFSDRNLLKPIGINKADDRAPILIKIFECAYDVCKAHVIKKATNEIDKLFHAPSRIYTAEEKCENKTFIPWKSRQEALSLLMSTEEVSKPSSLVNEIEKSLSQCEMVTNVTDIRDITATVASLVWSMTTVSPPVTFSHSFPLSDEHIELYDLTNLNDVSASDINNRKFRMVCRRPVLFYGPLGTIGEKGNIAVYPEILHDDVSSKDIQKVEKCNDKSMCTNHSLEVADSRLDVNTVMGKCIGREIMTLDLESRSILVSKEQESTSEVIKPKKKRRKRKKKPKIPVEESGKELTVEESFQDTDNSVE